jgi:hypothetical protein
VAGGGGGGGEVSRGLADLVNGNPVLVIHLVELVDEADPFVGQHQSPTLQGPLLRHRILLYGRRQTYGAGALACGQEWKVSEMAFRYALEQALTCKTQGEVFEPSRATKLLWPLVTSSDDVISVELNEWMK